MTRAAPKSSLEGSLKTQPGFRTVALIVASAMFMEQLDATVLATALPTMARDFGVSTPATSVALTSYLLSLAVFIPASGMVADRFCSRSVFRAAIAVFVLGSILCAQAGSLSFLVFARLLQGLGGAMMMPVGRLVLLRSVAKSDLVRAMSWMLVPALIGPVVGPPFGGFLVTYLDWRWIFYINVPIGLLGIVLVSLFIVDVKEEVQDRFDWSGLLLSGLSLGCLMFAFELSSRDDVDVTVTIGLFVIGAVAGLLYVRHARALTRARVTPILDVSLMRIETFSLAVIAGNITRITQGAQPFLLPLMLQLGFGYTAAQSGLVTLATACGSLAMKGIAPIALRRFGFRTTLIVNGFLASAGYAVCALFNPSWPSWGLYIVLGFAGFSMALQFTAYNTVAYDEIPASRMSQATSFYTTFQQLMLSTGICVGALALHISMMTHGRSEPILSDFSFAWVLVTVLSLSALFWNLRIPADAGAEISGHSRRVPAGREVPDPAE